MVRYCVVSFVSGLLFGTMDGLMQANPVAQSLFAFYKPIAKTVINVPAGVLIDLAYGFAMAGIFLVLYKSLPGATGFRKGLSFAVLVWFFRVVMAAASQWMMLHMPLNAVIYMVVAGLGEMAVLGILYGLTLKPVTVK